MTTPPKPEWMRPQGPSWSVRSERLVYQNPWLRLREFEAQAPTGAQTLYGVVGYANLAIGILPLFDDGTVALVGQHRFATGDYSWEIPEGGVPVAEDPLEGAKRELREETGLEAAHWRQVLRFDLSNSVTDERGFGFLATGLVQREADPDETEVLVQARIPFIEALELANSGHIRDMISVAILLRAYHMAREGDLEEPLASAMLRKTGERS